MPLINAEAVRKVYSVLADEVSRDIYANRCLYNLTGDVRYMREILRTNEESRDLEKYLFQHREQRMLLFGAGFYGRQLLYLYPEMPWVGFLDNRIQGQAIDGLPVYSPGEVMQRFHDAYIIVAVKSHSNEMEEQLLELGVLQDNILKLEPLIGSLASRQYFAEDVVAHDEHEVFVDCGAFDGMTSVYFDVWSQGAYDNIYSFEPEPSLIVQCRKRLSSLKRWQLIEKAAWSKNDVLSIAYDAERQGIGSYVMDKCAGGASFDGFTG